MGRAEKKLKKYLPDPLKNMAFRLFWAFIPETSDIFYGN